MHAKRREDQAAKVEAQKSAQVPAIPTWLPMPHLRHDADLRAFYCLFSLQTCGIAHAIRRQWQLLSCIAPIESHHA